MRKLESIETVERERERESYTLISRSVGLLSYYAEINKVNNIEISFANKCSKAMCFGGN